MYKRAQQTDQHSTPQVNEGTGAVPASGRGAAPGRGNQARLDWIAQQAREPLPNRSTMENSLGTDLSGIRVVLGGPEAEAALDADNANAASVQDSLVFREADPDPDLVSHEVVHWFQKFGVGNGAAPGGQATPNPEAEADDLSAAVSRGEPVQVSASASPAETQYDLRDTARDQHDKRRDDTPAAPGGSQRASFIDHDDQAAQLQHDHGFLDDGNGNIDESKREEATWSDRLELLKWIAKLEAAELLRPDLVDGTAAYRHFLEGGGATRAIDYERFIQGDSSGATIAASLQEDAQQAAMEKHDALIQGKTPEVGTTTFRMRTDAIPVGNDGRYPYPATENWQKAIGAHQLWMEMDVTVEVYEVSRVDPPGVEPGSAPVCTPDGDTTITYGRRFSVNLTVHMEDMYNFNPGAADIATGTPDAANGRFEVTGLGNEYLNTATFSRELSFEATMDPVAAPGSGGMPGVDSGRTPRTEGRPDGARRANPALR